MPEISVLIVGMLLTGVAGGILAGLLGVGGGIVIVPVLEGVLELLGVDASARMAHALSRRQLSVIFGCFLFAVSVRMLLQAFES